MNFLRTLFWVVVAAIAAVFATRNWTNTEVMLWGGLVAEVKLPVLLLFAFLLGLLPTLVWQQSKQWRLKRKLAEAERLTEPSPSAEPMIATAPPAPARGGAVDTNPFTPPPAA